MKKDEFIKLLRCFYLDYKHSDDYGINEFITEFKTWMQTLNTIRIKKELKEKEPWLNLM